MSSQVVSYRVDDATIVRLEIEPALGLLSEVFSASPDTAVDLDYAEPKGPRLAVAYAREHAQVYEPMRRLFASVREIATAISHEVGAFG